MENNKSQFLNDLKTRIILPFYIDKINSKFFSGFYKYKNKLSTIKIFKNLESTLSVKEIKKIIEAESISDHENILKLINRAIKRIVAVTGTKEFDFFVQKNSEDNKQPLFVEEKQELNDLKIIGDIHSERRYIYSVDVDKKCYLFKFVEQIQFSFYLDEKNNMISGGICWNWGNDNKISKDENYIEKIYLHSLIKNFIHKEIGLISLNNILTIFGENNSGVKRLYDKWIDLINNKIISKIKISKTDMNWLLNDLFYSIITTLLISLSVYEEIKIYFTHKKPEVYLTILKRAIVIKPDLDQNKQEDLFQLISLLKKSYFHWGKVKNKKFDDANEAISSLIEFDANENRSFGNPLWNYEIIRNSDSPFLDEDTDLFIKNKGVMLLFLIVLNPELFGINETNFNFIAYKDFLINIKEWTYDDEWKKIIDSMVDKYICEWNYDYISFINKNLTSLIIKNNNPILNIKKNNHLYEKDANRKLFNNYLWAHIYTQSIIYKANDIENNFENNKVKRPFLLRDYCYELDKLQFDWYDSFYGLPEIKKIVKKIDNFININKSIKQLTNKINREDKIYGKSKERKNIALAFSTAAMFGIIDFLTMVFTVLTVSDPTKGLGLPNVITIGFGSVIAFILFVTLSYNIIRPIVYRKKYKKNKK